MTPEQQETIHRFFARYITVSTALRLRFNEVFSIKEFSAHAMIVQAGEIDRHFHIVSQGVQALYLTDSNGDKAIIGFSYQGSPSGVFDSFIKQQPSSFFLESLTSSTLLSISKEAFNQTFEDFPELHQWKAQFLEDILFGRISREVEMMTLNAKDRFDAFIQRCPEELKVIPQKYLASYLNMKPETFSRLRAIRD